MARLGLVIFGLLILVAIVDMVFVPGERPEQRPGQPPGTDRRPPPRAPDPQAHAPEQPWRPPVGKPGAAIRPPAATDPSILITLPVEKRSSIGTAFSIDSRGVWLTARHVADGCQRIYIVIRPGKGLRVRSVYVHPRADIALLRTREGAPNLSFGEAALRLGQSGYHFGFPKGQPVAVTSSLIGRRVMRLRGRYATNEPVVAWAERDRVPFSDDSLGGISGGPALDGDGRVIGVTVAGTKRRGRIYTTAPVSIRDALRAAKVTPPARPTSAVAHPDNRNFVTVGAALRSKLTVAKVVCFARDRVRRDNPRRPDPGGGSQ